jgi:hypothetical protein
MSWMLFNIAVGYLLSLLVVLLVLRGMSRAYRQRYRHNVQRAALEGRTRPDVLHVPPDRPSATEIGLGRSA